MIRRGKREGWLHQAITDFQAWAELNGATIQGVKCDTIAGFLRSGVVALRPVVRTSEPLMFVPRDMILSSERIEQIKQTDAGLAELFTAVGDFGKSARGATVIFLLFSITVHYLQQKGVQMGTENMFIEYIKFLPEELLPTLWSSDEKTLLFGTTLLPAVEAKLRRLEQEYSDIRNATQGVDWCQTHWWDDVSGILSFGDWLQVDAMYRSRVVKFPPTDIGKDCMIPCIDMLNHTDSTSPAAFYEIDKDGNALLWPQHDGHIDKDCEVTISYGVSRTACEILYSYGFIEGDISSARGLLLDLSVPNDDPLGTMKSLVFEVRGVKLVENDGCIEWASDFVWLLCVNEEDGLSLLPPSGDRRKPRLLWKGAHEQDPSTLRNHLELDVEMWEIYQLRAITLIQERIQLQLSSLEKSNVGQVPHGSGMVIRQRCWELAVNLRELESKLLKQARAQMNKQTRDLLGSCCVQRYLARKKTRGADN